MADIVGMDGKPTFPRDVRPRLPREVQARIVTLYAHFQPVNEVQRIIKAEFGLEMDQRNLHHYDCSKPKARVGRRLRELFTAAREAYVRETAHVGISHQSHRLRLIERAIEKATTAKEFNAVARLLELAAREMGGTLTNVSKVEHAGAVEHRHLSVDDARSELVQRLAAALDGGVLTALPSPAKPLETDDKPEI